MKTRLLMTMSLMLASTMSFAMPVDLSTWVAEGGSSSWNVEAGNDSVLQTVNGAPTIFYDPAATSTQGTALTGNISVTTTSDDDFIGFVLGYDAGEVFSSTANFILVDWKQALQSGWEPGLAIHHISDGSNGNSTDVDGSYWGHTDGEVTQIQRAATLGDTGWDDLTPYEFSIVFTADLIEVAVDGMTELSITPGDVPGISSFDDGSFGFYNYSQPNVRYNAIAQVDCAITPDDPACVHITD
ncbi:MAG: PEP-CTERM sorting domain-containing protein [Pseudomonadota bacterium]